MCPASGRPASDPLPPFSAKAASWEERRRYRVSEPFSGRPFPGYDPPCVSGVSGRRSGRPRHGPKPRGEMALRQRWWRARPVGAGRVRCARRRRGDAPLAAEQAGAAGGDRSAGTSSLAKGSSTGEPSASALKARRGRRGLEHGPVGPGRKAAGPSPRRSMTFPRFSESPLIRQRPRHRVQRSRRRGWRYASHQLVVIAVGHALVHSRRLVEAQ